MSAKDSSGAKLLVVLLLGGAVAAGLFIRQRAARDDSSPKVTTTAGSADLADAAASEASVVAATPAVTPDAAPDATPPSAADHEALLEAAAAGDLAKVEALHQKGVALAGALGPAARSGNVPLLTWLVDHGLDVHEDESAKAPPLVLAEDHEAVVALLLARGVKEVDLVTAVAANAPKTVARLLAKKANPNATTDLAGTTLASGESLLHYAVHAGAGPKRAAVVRALLEAGAKPEVGLGTETPLVAAIREVEAQTEGALDVVKLLAGKATVDPDAMSTALGMHADQRAAVLDVLLSAKLTPEAAYRGLALTTDAKLVPRIAAKGVAWGHKDPMVETPPLLGAARALDTERVRALLAAGAPVEGGDDAGETPLLAVIDGAPPDSEAAAKIVDALLGKGANPNRRAKDGRRPLHVAAGRGDEAIVKALLAKGAHVDDEVNGTSPLEAAEANGHVTVAKLLAAKGAKKKLAPKD